jgi:hypothetical protein
VTPLSSGTEEGNDEDEACWTNTLQWKLPIALTSAIFFSCPQQRSNLHLQNQFELVTISSPELFWSA